MDVYIDMFGDGTYFIHFKNCFANKDTALYLSMTLKQFEDILKKFGATNNGDNDLELAFNNRIDAKKALEFLEPYIIAAKLRGDFLKTF